MSRDGLIIAGDIPDDISGETFGIMCATLLGAACTANSELKASPPSGVVVEGEDCIMILLGAGRKALIVAALPRDVDRDAARKKLESLAETIRLI